MADKIVINGWVILSHPLFLKQLEDLTREVDSLKERDPSNFGSKNATKRLAAIKKLAFEKIPEDPSALEYRQGATLGGNNKHWFRAKFFQQYRLFFRYHQESKIIIYVWVNDDSTKRTYDSKTYAYLIFKKMLQNGNPPNTWDELLKAANKPTMVRKLVLEDRI